MNQQALFQQQSQQLSPAQAQSSEIQMLLAKKSAQVLGLQAAASQASNNHAVTQGSRQ